MTTELEDLVRAVMGAYNAGDPEPLIQTFDPRVIYRIIDLDKTYEGLLEVTELARSGAGNTRFHINSIICSGPLVSFSYRHENHAPGIEYSGPGMAVQRYNNAGKLCSHWAFRSVPHTQ